MRAGQRQLMIFAAVFAVPSTVQSEDFAPIFDGQSLSGWEGNHEQFLLDVVDNPDPFTFRSLLDRLEPGRTMFNVVSKSLADSCR